MTPELNGVARAFLETVERVRRDFGADVAVVRTSGDTAAAELRAQVAALAAQVATLQAQAEPVARALVDIRADEADRLEQVRRTLGDDVAGARADNEAAAERIAALEIANAALTMQLAERAHSDAEWRESITRSLVAGFRLDGGELVLHQSGGTEFRATLPAPDTAAIAVHVVERHLDTLRGDPGEHGDKGDPGTKGDKGDRGDVGPVAEPAPLWVPGVYRAGTRRSHAMGRVYEAATDTAAEPGESADWRRLGSTGFAVIGGREPTEPGDFHLRDGATFLFDGAKSWLVFPTPFTRSDAEAMLKPHRASVRELTSSAAAQAHRIDGVTDVARGADARSREVADWVNEYGPALVRLLLANRPKAA